MTDVKTKDAIMSISKEDAVAVLESLHACDTGIQYVARAKSPEAAYMRCTDPARLQWFLEKLGLFDDEQKLRFCFRVLTELSVNAKGQTIAELSLYSYPVVYATFERFAQIMTAETIDWNKLNAMSLTCEFMFDAIEDCAVIDFEIAHAIDNAIEGYSSDVRVSYSNIYALTSDKRRSRSPLCRLMRELVSPDDVREAVALQQLRLQRTE